MVRVEITDLTKPQVISCIIGTCAHFSSMDHKKNIGGNLMTNILENLYYGNITPSQRSVRPNSRVQTLMNKQSDLETKLNDSLTKEQRANFEQYLSITVDLLDTNCLDSFIIGFRLGARFTHEIFIGTDAPFADLTDD